MTTEAQHAFIIGAMCVDDAFRNGLLAARDITEPQQSEKISEILTGCESKFEVALDKGVLTTNIQNFLQSQNVQQAEGHFLRLKAIYCPMWPCP